MSGPQIDEAAKLVHRAGGRLSTIVVKRRISRSELKKALDELVEGTEIIRKVLEREYTES